MKSVPCPKCGGKGKLQVADSGALRIKRLNANIQAKEMAARCNLHESYISDIELGRRPVPERVRLEYERL